MKTYLETNRKLWNDKTAYHLNAEFYDVQSFIEGQTSLNEIELKLLPASLEGKKVLHLQCHFGQDSISLARMGALVTAVDFSDEAIKAAHELAKTCGEDVQFICCDVYSLPEELDDSFDYIFTSYGTIPWLPDLSQWGALINRFLKQNGALVFVEFHPFIWMFDDEFQALKYDYFNTGEIIELEEGTYADRDAAIRTESITWNHPLSEVIHALIENGLSIDQLDEYDYSPYPCFKEVHQKAEKQFQIKGINVEIPMVYSILARKKKF